MTERPPRDAGEKGGRPVAVARPPHPGSVVTAAIATFLVVLALLSWQMSTGHDPALGKGFAAAERKQPAKPRPAKRRVVVTTVVHHPVTRPSSAASSVAATTSAVPVSVPSAPATAPQSSPPSSPSPRPAPSPAPAPAPTPAPVTTQSS